MDQYLLLVEFDNSTFKHFDVKPLLNKPAFAALCNPALFRLAAVEKGGYAVVWNSDIDISEYELWQGGILLEQPENAL